MKKMSLVVMVAVLCVFLSLFFTQPLHAQTAVRLEAILDTPELSWSQAAAFILEAADLRSGSEWAQADKAFEFAMEQRWLPKHLSPGDTARLNGAALLLMRSFDIKGGIFFRAGKSPHHAYRELVHKKVIRGNSDPDMTVSGQQLLLMVNKILAMKGEDG